MFIKKNPLFIFPAILLIVQLACNIPSGAGTPDTAATLNGLYTASAQTLESLSTQTGFTATPGLPLPTATIGTPVSTVPANTAVVQSPVPVSRCDAAVFVSDVSYPDGTVVSRGGTFVKTWRIKNAGTCSWTPSYALVFVSGDAMGGASVVAMPGNVNPGQTVDLSVTLVAPSQDGKYRGYWKLRNASNALFGIGAQADAAFWVDIKVGGPTYTVYDFVANYCSAHWENNDTELPCPGIEDDDNGYVIKLNTPKMEDGNTENEPGLLTFPQNASDGIIAGQYPAFTVQSGDRFRTIVNCQDNAKKCDVIFRLNYKNNGQVKTLASWHEVYEGKYSTVDLDLSNLAGQTVKFILLVDANGSSKRDEAIWLGPHILRQGVLPTPTFTSTSTSTFTPTPTFTPTITPTATPTSTSTPTP